MADFGFHLDDEAPAGAYRIEADGDAPKTRRGFRVEFFRKPSIELEVKRNARGGFEASAFYPDGKPAAGALALLSLRGAEPVEVGRFGEDGRVVFPVPQDRSFGTGEASFTVDDRAGCAESAQLKLGMPGPLSFRISAAPEAGKLVPGVSNLVHLAVTGRGGTVRDARVSVWVMGREFAARTGESGHATVEMQTPDALLLRDSSGDENLGRWRGDLKDVAFPAFLEMSGMPLAGTTVKIPVDSGPLPILLRPRVLRAVAGAPVGFDVFTNDERGEVTVDAWQGPKHLASTIEVR